uniref:Immunoglobulin V-set domain-containing protein n=1 Tax=Coturnix japonica TaxID=93934 RepID=A0A8C2TD56_COTJA
MELDVKQENCEGMFEGLLVLLWITVTGALPGDFSLTQLALLSANLGGTIRITCSGINSDYGWYQQKSPGSAPVTAVYYCGVWDRCCLHQGTGRGGWEKMEFIESLTYRALTRQWDKTAEPTGCLVLWLVPAEDTWQCICHCDLC